LNQDSDFYTVQSPEFFAEQTGFIQGFAAGRSLTDKQEWLLHCPGAVGMARGNEADSASTDFYIVIGQAPRQLDRNMTVFAQVIYGLENIQKMHRGDRNIDSGVISEDEKRSKILNMSMGNTLDESKQMLFKRDTVLSSNFQKRLSEARTLSNEFYHHKGSGKVDVCYYRPLYSLVEEL
jgi:peptidylprolyl isomerase